MRIAIGVLLGLVLAANSHAQTAAGVTRLLGPVGISMNENIELNAAEGEHNEATGELVLRGNVTLRQAHRPAMQPVAAANLAGVPFPTIAPVSFRMSGGVQIAVGSVRITAESAEVNGLTGEMTLSGEVRVRREK